MKLISYKQIPNRIIEMTDMLKQTKAILESSEGGKEKTENQEVGIEEITRKCIITLNSPH